MRLQNFNNKCSKMLQQQQGKSQLPLLPPERTQKPSKHEQNKWKKKFFEQQCFVA
jgi:hypothetical protein